ncbi:MAG: xanthine dehydrogenase family protein molybdopterin-binding subunit [Pseudomonadota bacterium]
MTAPASSPFTIGAPTPRSDAAAKAAGLEKFAADLYEKNGLWAGVKRAGIPHARLTAVVMEQARQVPGVKMILTHTDVKGSNRQGVVQKDQPVLVDHVIRHRGDAVALVVADSRKALDLAVSLITLEADPLPGIFDMDQALAVTAPVIHPDHPGGNCLLGGELVTGKGLAAFEECPVQVAAHFDLPRQEHAYLETECGMAIYQDGLLTITASTQTPFRDRAETAHALGLTTDRVRVIAPFCGGGFGGKDGITVQSLLGLAALACPGIPIKMWWDREESFLAGSKRHAARIFYRLGALEDGTLHALEARIDLDTGPYDHLGGVVLALAMEHAGGPYRIPNTVVRGRAIYTNNTIGGAFRGFGVPQAAAAMEQTLDMMAQKLTVTPLEIRRKNAVVKGDRNSTGVTLQTSTGMVQCLDRLQAHPLYREAGTWKSMAGPFKLRGVGLAAVMHGTGYGPVVPDVANARLELTRDGRFRVFCGVVDMGQGNASTFLQIAGDLLNQDPGHLDLVLPDTDRSLPSGSASASRTTTTFGWALSHAACDLKQRLLQRAADSLMVRDIQEFALVPGSLRHLPTGRDIPLAFLASLMNDAERSAVSRYRAPTAMDNPAGDQALRMHGIPHLVFSHGAHLARVEIDTLTGAVTVCQYLAVTDCGRLINPDLYRQQMHGGIAQGIGYALYEEIISDQGRLLTPDLATYIIPGSMDVPSMDLESVDLPEHTGPFGMKGVGEIAIDAPLPAIANAVADACGGRCRHWPLTPERMLNLLTSPLTGD